jgi:hypothetical protein
MAVELDLRRRGGNACPRVGTATANTHRQRPQPPPPRRSRTHAGQSVAFSTGSTDIEKCQQDWQTGEKAEREEKRGNRKHNREHRDARTYVATASLLAYRHGRMVGAGTAGTSVSQVSSSGRFSPLLGRKSRRSTRRVRSLADELDLLVEEQHAVVRQCSNMSPECDDYLTGDRPSSQAGALARPEATSGGRHLGSASA